jgi:hypothetical protein
MNSTVLEEGAQGVDSEIRRAEGSLAEVVSRHPELVCKQQAEETYVKEFS